MKPQTIIASNAFMAAYEAERTRQEWLDAGADWRRAKREANKVAKRSWRQAAVDLLDRLAKPQYTGISRDIVYFWRPAVSGWPDSHA